MGGFRGVLIDLGGVVYQGGAALPGAVAAVGRLRAADLPFRFLTNTTSQPVSGILEKLAQIGLRAERGDIFTPVTAARAYIEARGLRPHFLIAPALEDDFRGMACGDRPAVVIGDAGDGFTYARLNEAFRHLRAGAAFIALARNRYFSDAQGAPCLDVGAFVAALEYASQREAVVLGKPDPAFFHLAVEDMGLSPQEAVMIGDDAEFDVAAAIRAGLSGYLVQTGKWRAEDALALTPAPSGEFPDLGAAVAQILGSAG
jgi:HAD superfamily hydrolase (TIGR01458 family)